MLRFGDLWVILSFHLSKGAASDHIISIEAYLGGACGTNAQVRFAIHICHARSRKVAFLMP